VENSIFIINITLDEGSAQSIYGCIKDNMQIDVSSWILPGLKVENQTAIESGGKTVVAGCRRGVDLNVYVWLAYA
jgi:uncharacterized protein YraI